MNKTNVLHSGLGNGKSKVPHSGLSNGFPSGGSGVGVTLAAAARTFISFMRPDFVKEKILLCNLLILRITSILKIILVIDNPYGSR
jgi:hypothetical protein